LENPTGTISGGCPYVAELRNSTKSFKTLTMTRKKWNLPSMAKWSNWWRSKF